MGFFDIFKSSYSNKISIDLSDFKFLSDDHIRIENGRPTTANNKGARRGIRIKTADNAIFFVTMYNMNENHPVWGDNIQMAEKRMKVIEESTDKIVLRGYGTDAMGTSFADYGLTLHKSNTGVSKLTLHMYDTNIEIVYLRDENIKQFDIINQISDFDNFKNFTIRWNTSMSMQEKIQIARQSDLINNLGADAYENDDYLTAIKYFEQALELMPNNDDALKNLIICYRQIGNHKKVQEMDIKLKYLK